MGIVKIILERKLPVSLSESISAAARGLFGYAPKLKVTPEAEKSVLDFLIDRARYIFLERESFAYDEINAVIAAGADDLSVTRDLRTRAVFGIGSTSVAIFAVKAGTRIGFRDFTIDGNRAALEQRVGLPGS